VTGSFGPIERGILTINSHAVYAKTRKLSETNACSSAMPKIPKKTALQQSINIRVVWQALDFSFLSESWGWKNCTEKQLDLYNTNWGVALLRRIGI
jgi:hypothetical protein